MDILDGALNIRFPKIYDGQFQVTLNSKCSMDIPKVMLTNNGIVCFCSSVVANTALNADEVFLTLPQNCRPKRLIEIPAYCASFNGSAVRPIKIATNGKMSIVGSTVSGTGKIWLNGLMFSINDNYV